MSCGPSQPYSTDRRTLAAQMCHLLAHRAEDPDLPLDVIGQVAAEIAAFLRDGKAEERPVSVGARLRVIEGGRQ